MTSREHAAEAVRVAEKAVGKLVSEMGAAHDWDEAARLIDLGRQLRLLAEQTVSLGSTASPSTESETFVSQRAAGKPGSKKTYPHFFREGETLVKVAWSKSQRSEYEHKAPRKVISLLVEALAKAGPKAKRFTMDKLLPLRDGGGGAEVPEYQVYVGLAWLRDQRLVEQHGRSGYSIGRPETLVADSATCWDKLKAR